MKNEREREKNSFQRMIRHLLTYHILWTIILYSFEQVIFVLLIIILGIFVIYIKINPCFFIFIILWSKIMYINTHIGAYAGWNKLTVQEQHFEQQELFCLSSSLKFFIVSCCWLVSSLSWLVSPLSWLVSPLSWLVSAYNNSWLSIDIGCIIICELKSLFYPCCPFWLIRSDTLERKTIENNKSKILFISLRMTTLEEFKCIWKSQNNNLNNLTFWGKINAPFIDLFIFSIYLTLPSYEAILFDTDDPC